MKTFKCGATLLAFLACFTAVSSAAQDFPSKPLLLIVPYGVGGGTDSSARVMAGEMGKHLGQSVIVENRTGAAGAIGAGSVAKENPMDTRCVIAASVHR